MRNILKILGLFWCTTGYATSQKPLRAIEASMPIHQQSQMQQDEPFRSVTVLDNYSILAVGKTSVWRYDLDKRQLDRIRLPIKEGEAIQAAASSEDFLVIATDHKMLALEKETLTLSKFPLKNHSNQDGETLTLSLHGSHALWAHEAGLFSINLKSKTLEARPLNPIIQRGDRLFQALSDPQKLWVVRGRYLIELAPGLPDVKVLQKGFSKFWSSQRFKGHLVLATRNTMLSIDSKGQISRAIPVTGSRQLMARYLAQKTQAYLLSDGTVEIFDHLGEFRYAHLEIDLDDIHSVEMAQRGPVLVLNLDGKLKNYVLPPPSPSGMSIGSSSPPMRY